MTYGIQNPAQRKRGTQGIAVWLVVRGDGQPAGPGKEGDEFGYMTGIHSANVRVQPQ